MSQFFGKYQGKVENNVDPYQMGRVQVSVPAVLGDGQMSWAMPCTPYAGSGVGLFLIPPTGTNVWVEFAGGDPDYPIWTGCFWGKGEVPAMPAMAEKKMLKTDAVTLTIDDTPGAGGVTLEIASPAVATPIKVVMDSSGIEITLTPAKVKITTSEIEISHNPAKVKITPSDVEIALSPASVKLESSAVKLSLSPAEVKLSSSGVDLKNGGQTVKLSSSSVSINDGALEVM
jgi:hypothetical protein